MYSAYQKPVIAVLDQDPPILNTWYTVLPQTQNVRLLYIVARRLDDDVVDKTMKVEVVVDGVTHVTSNPSTDNTWYYMYLRPWAGGALQRTTNIFNASYYCDLRGKEVMVRVQQLTDAIGANAELDGRVQYEVMNP